jgi:AraC-like DNA-binding protein
MGTARWPEIIQASLSGKFIGRCPLSYEFRSFLYAIRCAARKNAPHKISRFFMTYQVSIAEAQQAESPAPGWVRLQLPEELGECYSDRFALGGDLTVVHSRYQPTRDIVEQSIQQNGSRSLVMTFGIQSESGYLSSDGHALAFRGGCTTVSSFHNSAGERHFKADSPTTQLRLLVGENTLKQYLGTERSNQLLGSETIRQLDFRKTSPATQAHINALMRCAATHSDNALDMHIHMLNLLADQLRFLAQDPAETIRLSELDIEKLESIRTFMQENMERSLSISYLCATAGVNESKLKEGFRLHFKTTPHRMLMEFRMHKALTLLESGRQVAEAAYQVGYQHPSNFSAAFTRFFGKSPKSVFGKHLEKPIDAIRSE